MGTKRVGNKTHRLQNIWPTKTMCYIKKTSRLTNVQQLKNFEQYFRQWYLFKGPGSQEKDWLPPVKFLTPTCLAMQLLAYLRLCETVPLDAVRVLR